MNKIIRKKRVSKISLFLNNREKIKKSHISMARAKNNDISSDLKTLKSDFLHKQDIIKHEINQNKILNNNILIANEELKKEESFSVLLKNDISKVENEIFTMEKERLDKKIEIKENSLKLKNLEKKIEIKKEDNNNIIQERDLLSSELERVKQRINDLEKENDR